MIRDEELKAAACELEQVLADELPDPKECDREFSTAFERRMKKTAYRANHPFAVRWGQRVAAAILVVLLLGGSVLAGSPYVRAAFVGWVKDICGTAVNFYIPDGTAPGEVYQDYRLGWVPEGYTLLDILENPGATDYVYVDADGRLLIFGYTIPTETSSPDVGFEVEGHTHKIVTLGDLQADLYLSGSEEKSSVLFWVDKSGTVLFFIQGILDEAVLIQLAESITFEK